MKIAIFASGKGSNARNIINHFNDSSHKFLVVTNNLESGVVDVAWELGVSCIVHSPKDNLLNILKSYDVDFIILAGYLKLISLDIISSYQNKIINIHPSLLPKYGGKGMWGINIHNEVIKNKETESGITIHYVSQNYDEGEIIEQHNCEVLLCDTPESLAKKISLLERDYFPKCIERLIGL